jgi:hypothetical protein
MWETRAFAKWSTNAWSSLCKFTTSVTHPVYTGTSMPLQMPRAKESGLHRLRHFWTLRVKGWGKKKNMVQFEGIFNGWDNMWSIRSEYWFIVVHRWFFMVVDVYLWLCLIIYGSYWVQLGTISPSSWGPYNCGILYPLITRSCLTPFWRNESIYIIHHNPSLIDVWLMFVGCMGISKREIVGNIMASSEYPNLFWSTSCSQVHI